MLSPRALLLLLALSPLAAQPGPELLANPGFDAHTKRPDLPDAWSTDTDRIHYQETVAFGGDWELVSRPGQYVLATQDVKLEPGKTYTFMFEARGTADARAGALLLHGAERPREELPLIWQQRLQPEYHRYYRTFVAPNPAGRIFLYNVAKVGEVAYRAVSLRQGTPDTPVIRDLAFGPMDEPAEPPRVTPHFAWATPLAGGPLKVLFVTRDYRALREQVELAQRLELDYDLLYTGEENAASPTALRAQERLERGAYDAYFVNGPLPEAFQRVLAKALAAGKGVVVMQGSGRPAGLFDPATLPVTPADHYLRRDLPWSVLAPDLLAGLRAGDVGPGRAVRIELDPKVAMAWAVVPCLRSQKDWQSRTLRYWEYEHAFIARCLAWVARRDADVHLAATADATGITLSATGLPAGARLELTPRSGRELRFGRPDLQFAACLAQPGQPVAWPQDFPAGPAVADVRVLDGQGRVVYWAGLPSERPREGALAAVAVMPELVRPGQPVVLTATAGAPGRVEAELVDAWGRVQARAAQTLAQPGLVRVSLDTRRTVTTGNKLFVRLTDADGLELDSAWRDVLIPELNAQHAWDDFHVTSWGDGSINPPVSHVYNQMVRELGFNGKFQGYLYGADEDGLYPGTSPGVPGLYPNRQPRPDHVRGASTLSDPVFLQKMDDSLAERMPPLHRYGVAAWSLGDELELTHINGLDEVDFSPVSLAAFRAWLPKQYANLDALNRAWGTAYTSFEQAQPVLSAGARKSGRYAPFVDFRTFMMTEWIRVLTHATAKLREYEPNGRVGHTNTFGATPFNGSEYYRLGTAVGFTWGQEYGEEIKPEAQKAVFELWRSFTPDDFPNLGWVGYAHRPPQVRYEPWWLAFHGSRGVSYFATNAVDPGRGISYALVHPTQTFTPYSQAVKEALTDLVGGCGKALMTTRAVEPEVALLWSWPSLLASWCESTWDAPTPPDRLPFDSYGAFFRAAFNVRLNLEAAGVAYRYVAPEQLADAAALKRYKVLFLPAVAACDPASLAAIRRYQREGGVVVGDVNLLKYDAHGAPLDSAAVESLFGAKPAGATKWEPVQVEGGFEGYGWQPLTLTTGQPAKKLTNGATALVETTVGQGRGVLVNTLLPGQDPAAAAWVAALCDRAGVARPVRITRADGTDALTGASAQRRADGPMELVGVTRDPWLGPKDETQAPLLRVRFGRTAWVTDVRGRRVLGRVDHVDVPLAAGEAKLYALLPYQVTGLTLSAPATARPGDELPLEATVAADGPAGRHVLHVDLLGPDGQARPGYTANVVADGGRWRTRLPLGWNEPAGEYQVRVRDVVGAREAVAKVTVRSQ